MSANALVCDWYQTCAWFTPRITNGVPLASTTRVPSTRRPTAAGCEPRAVTTAGYQRPSIFWMPVELFGCTPSVVSAAVSNPVHWSTTVIGDAVVLFARAQPGMAALRSTTRCAQAEQLAGVIGMIWATT